MSGFAKKRPPAYEAVPSYEDWMEQTWEATEEAMRSCIKMMKEHGLVSLTLDKPFQFTLHLHSEAVNPLLKQRA